MSVTDAKIEANEDVNKEFEDAFEEFADDEPDKDPLLDTPETPAAAEAAADKEGEDTVVAGDDTADNTATTDPDPIDWDKQPANVRAAHEAAQQEIEDLKHKDSSNRGRLTAFERDANARRTAPAPAPGGDKDPATPGYRDSDEWKGAADDYEEVMKPVATGMDALHQENRQLGEQVARLEARAVADEVGQQVEYLAQEHADWQDHLGEKFLTWADGQPRNVQEAVVRNSKTIVDGYEAAKLITDFKRDSGFVDPISPSDPATEQATEEEQASAAEKRKRQLKNAASPTSKGVGVGAGEPEDYDAAFEFHAEKHERNRKKGSQ